MAAKPPNATVLALLKTKALQLQADPKNEDLRTSILKTQVDLTADQLGTTTLQAANIVRAYTAAYATSTGADPKAVLDALTSAQQQILNYDKNKPTLYGLDLVTANKIASYFAAASGVLLTVALGLVIVGIFTVGPEAVAVFAGATSVVGLFQAAVAAVGLDLGAATVAAGGAIFLLSQFCGHFANVIPMITKQMVDNGTIAASLQITAIKNVQEVQAQLTGTKAPGSYSQAQFQSLYNGFAANGITQVKNPETGAVVPLTQQSLADLITTLYGRAVLAGSPATPTKLTPLLNPWLLKGGTPSGSTAAPASTSSGGSTASTIVKPAPVQIQIFSGVVSSGTLGLATEFVARADDMIDTVDELTAAAKNNLAAFVASLPGKFYYEVSIVPTVKTRAGSTVKGGAVQIISGYLASGKPKYKTIYNKFAVMKLGVVDANGKTVNLGTITLGPVNSSQFNPTQAELAGVNDNIKSNTFTSDISAISTVIAPQGLAVATVMPDNPSPAPAPVAVAPNYTVNKNVWRQQGDLDATMLMRDMPDGGLLAYSLQRAPNDIWDTEAELNASLTAHAYSHDARARLKSRWNIDFDALPVRNYADFLQAKNMDPNQAGKPHYRGTQGFIVDNSTNIKDFLGGDVAAAALPPATNTALQAATNLTEAYGAFGVALPVLAVRATLYENWGLGAATTYAGTAEQNGRLLATIKSKGSLS